MLSLYAKVRPLLHVLCACGSSFSVDHVLSCPKGGLPSLCHIDIRDLVASLLTELCSQVIAELELHNPDNYMLLLLLTHMWVLVWMWQWMASEVVDMAFTYWNMGCTFYEWIFRIFRDGWKNCRDAFRAVLCLYCCVEHSWVQSILIYGHSNNWSLRCALAMHTFFWSSIRILTNHNYF